MLIGKRLSIKSKCCLKATCFNVPPGLSLLLKPPVIVNPAALPELTTLRSQVEEDVKRIAEMKNQNEMLESKVKELTVMPGQSLSNQRHFKRSEYWVVEEGACNVANDDEVVVLSTHETIDIPVNNWHQLINPFTDPCRIVEIQYGSICEEYDIERQEQ